MAFKKLNFRCTYTEEERWKSAARKTGRSLSAWLRWLANTASDVPMGNVSVAESLPPVPAVSGVNPMSGPPKPPGYEVKAELDDGVPTPRVVATVGSPSASASMPDYQDAVLEIVFEKPATWKLVTEGGLRTSTSKRPDPSSKKWAKQDLMTFCVENDVVGFQRAWDAMESEMSDGGFAG